MSRRSRSRRSRNRGGGYSFNPSQSAPITAGVLPVLAYSGVGKDCAAMPSSPILKTGLPGLSGGSRRRRSKGGRYTFDSSFLATPAPIVRDQGCAMRGGSVTMNPAYVASTAGYSTKMDTSSGVPMTINVGYPDRQLTPACMKGGKRSKRSKKTRRNKTRRHH